MTFKSTLFFGVFFIALALTNLNAQNINWHSLPEAEKLQSEQPEKEILVSFYATWCGWCRKMDITTFEDPKVAEYINEHFIPVKFDAEGKEKVNFQGKSYQFVGKDRAGMNSFAYWTLDGRRSYPALAIIDKDGKMQKLLRGYYSKDQILPLLN